MRSVPIEEIEDYTPTFLWYPFIPFGVASLFEGGASLSKGTASVSESRDSNVGTVRAVSAVDKTEIICEIAASCSKKDIKTVYLTDCMVASHIQETYKACGGKEGFLRVVDHDPHCKSLESIRTAMEDSRLVIIEADSKDFHSDWYDVVLIDRLAKETNTAILVLIDSHININFSFKSMFEVKKERDVLYIESVKNTLACAEGKRILVCKLKKRVNMKNRIMTRRKR